MIPNHTSTRIIHDADVGVKWTWIRGFAASHARAATFLCVTEGTSRAWGGGEVVHHQMQLLIRIRPRHMFEKHEKLLVTVPRSANSGHLAGRNLQRREQCGGAATDVVVSLLLGDPDLHRQRRSHPIQCLNLRFLVHAEHDRVLRRIEIQPDDVGHLRNQFRIG